MKLATLSLRLAVFVMVMTSGVTWGADPSVATAAVIPLRGVVLRQALKDFSPDGSSVQGLDVQASAVVAVDPIFRTRVEAMLGQPITLRLLQEISAEVVLAYRRVGRPLADAAVPEQRISNGTVQVVVLEARLGTVRVEGAKHFSPERMKAVLRTLPGEPLVAGTLFSDLDWLNQNSFRRVDLVYERGRDLSTTDVVLRVTEQRPWMGLVGYENENADSLGRDRWFAGVRAGNLWGAEHQFSAIYTQGRQASVYRGLTTDYTVPFRWRDVLTVSASIAEPNVGGDVFDSKGRSWRLALRYGGEFARTRLWQFGWAAGYEVKSSDNDILFGGTTVFSGAYETHEFFGEVSARRPGPTGESTLKAALYVSPGDIGSKNSSADLSAGGRSHIGARYAFVDLGAGHKFALPRDFFLNVSTRLRLTNDRLPASSQFGFGGAAQFPGYAESAAMGDGAAWAQAQVQSPVFHVFRATPDPLADAVRFSAYYTAGEVLTRNLSVLEFNQGIRKARQLESFALGATYEFSRRFQLNAVYGWQLRSPATGIARSSRGHLSAILNF